MKKVEMYSSGLCGYCYRAKKLLEDKGMKIEVHDVTMDPKKRAEMEARSGRYTVPQVFVDNQSIGGAEELYALDKAGELDKILGLK